MVKLLTHGQLELRCIAWYLGNTLSLGTHFRILMIRYNSQALYLVYIQKQEMFTFMWLVDYLSCHFLTGHMIACQIVNNPLHLPDDMNPLLKNLIEGLLCKGLSLYLLMGSVIYGANPPWSLLPFGNTIRECPILFLFFPLPHVLLLSLIRILFIEHFCVFSRTNV